MLVTGFPAGSSRVTSFVRNVAASTGPLNVTLSVLDGPPAGFGLVRVVTTGPGWKLSGGRSVSSRMANMPRP